MHSITLFFVAMLCSSTFGSTSTYFTSTNASVSLTTYYATIGSAPLSEVVANVTVLSSSNVTLTCQWELKNGTNIAGTVVLFAGPMPAFQGCNSNSVRRHLALALMAQASGALAVVAQATEEV